MNSGPMMSESRKATPIVNKTAFSNLVPPT
jgi:hypothetical protein